MRLNYLTKDNLHNKMTGNETPKSWYFSGNFVMFIKNIV